MGEEEEARIVFDCKKIREDIRTSSRKDSDLIELLKDCTEFQREVAHPDSHYYSVEMIGIEYGSDFLSSKRIEEYLEEHAPIDYSSRFIYSSSIYDFLGAKKISLDNVRINLHSDEFSTTFMRKVKRPYKTHYKTAKNLPLEIEGIEFIEDKREPDCPRYWGWYSINDLIGVIDDNLSGIRFRKKNIEIGSTQISNSLFRGKNESRLNRWILGEIHILDSNVIPNSRRDDFEDTEEWTQIKEDLKPFFEAHQKRCHQESQNRNEPIPKFKKEMMKIKAEFAKIKDEGFISEDDRSLFNRKIEDVEQTIGKLTKKFDTTKNKTESEILNKEKEKLSEIKSELNNHKVIKTKHFASKLSKHDSDLINRIIRIVSDEINAIDCPRSQHCLRNIVESVEREFK